MPVALSLDPADIGMMGKAIDQRRDAHPACPSCPPRPYEKLTVQSDGSVIVTWGDVLLRIDPDTGNRTVVSSEDETPYCLDSGNPWSCCTGTGISNGTPPCAAVGSGASLNLNGLASFLPVPPAPSVHGLGLLALGAGIFGISALKLRRR